MSDTEEKVLDDDNKKPTESSNDAYAYLDRDRFTAEKYKVEIRNLPKYYGMPELKKLLSQKLRLDVSKVKRPKPGAPWVYICLRSEDAREEAIKALAGYNWKGNELQAYAAKAIPDPYIVNRQKIELERSNEPRNLIEELNDATTPLWRIPYPEQLEKKTKDAEKLLRNLSKELGGQNPNLKNWLAGQRKKFKDMPCELFPIRHSSVTDGYRTKCEFTIGVNEVTKEKTIGMRVGSYSKGSMCVVTPSELLHVPNVMKKAVAVSELFIRSSRFDVYNQETHEGHWNSLTARFGFRTNELMLMFIFKPGKLTDEEIEQIEIELKEYFTKADLNLYSLMLAISEVNCKQPKVKLVMGQPYLHEQICGLTLRISPLAFFQVNTPVAEMMFNAISEIGDLNENTSLFDVCCGAGTIGLALAKSCGQVLGLEICEEAIIDAKLNAKENNINNADFYTGKAEEMLSVVIRRAKNPNVLIVVDPPRAGLGWGAIAQLRKTEQVKKFIYVSCQPQLAFKNFIDFGRPASKKYPGEPFVPTRCLPFDMFPHTPGVELVFLFERISLLESETTNET